MTYEFMDPLDVLIDREDKRNERARLAREMLKTQIPLLWYIG